MKNLIKQKFVFGLLMTCLLALGMAGIADAFTITKTQTDPVINTTTVSFRVTFTQAEAEAHSGARDNNNAIVEDNAKTYTIALRVSPAVGITSMTGSTPSGATSSGGVLTWAYDPTAAGDVTFTAAIAYTTTAQGRYTFSANNIQVFVNYQTVTTENRDVTRIDAPDILPILNSSSGPQSFSFNVGSGQVGDRLEIDIPAANVTVRAFTHTNFINILGKSSILSTDTSVLTSDPLILYATSTSGGSITVNYQLTDVGSYPFTVGANDETFTAYGVRHAGDVTDLAFVATNNKIETGDTNPTNNYFFDEEVAVTLGPGPSNSANHTWALVDFRIVSGSGVLYEDLDGDRQPDPGKSPGRTVTTFTNNRGTASQANVRLQMRGTTNVIEASIRNSNLTLDRNKHVITYFYQYPQIVKISGDAQVGTPSTQLQHPLVVEVRDAKGTAIPGQEVVFGRATGSTNTFNVVTGYPDIDMSPAITTGDAGNDARIVTDRSGQAQIYAVLPANVTDTASVTVWIDNNGDATFDTATEYQIMNPFTATIQAATTSLASIGIDSGDGQTAARNAPVANPLVVIVRDERGLIDQGVDVIFTTDSGVLSAPLAADPGSEDTGATNTTRRITVDTDSTGRASVRYNVGDVPGAKAVRASINTGTAFDQIRHVTFNINGTGSSGGGDPATNPYLSISVSPTRAVAGTSGRVTVNAFNASRASVSNVPVTLSAPGITFFPNPVQSGSSATFTFPSSGTPTITATATNYTTATATITVTPPTEDTAATLTLSPSTLTGSPAATVTLSATVQGQTVSGVGVTFTLSGASGGAVLNPIAITNNSGVASTQIVLPATSGGTVTASATVDGTSLTQTAGITVTGGTGDTGTGTGTDDQEDTVSLPSQLSIPGSSNLSGEINRRLAEELRVQVLDANNNGVSAETVFFRITEGRGRLSPARTRTDISGYAEVGFTPQSSGTIEVEVTSGTLDPVTFTITTGEPPAALVPVSGNNQSGRPSERLANPFIVEVVDRNDDPVLGVTVTFAVTAGGGTLSTTTATTNGTGRAQTYLRLGEAIGENTVVATVSGLTDRITFTARTGAEVLVSAAQRPPMYWISRTEGKLHRLVGAEVENLAPNIDGILSLTVDTENRLLYWTRQTAESKSAIQRAGLNGRGVITLQTSLTLMTSIAVDSTGTTLYWADILGKIKSRPVQGNRVTLLAQNLSSPTGLVWANEYLYWGEATGQIRRMNLRNNRRTIETITTSSGEPVSLAVHSGRVYWTEISGNAAQLNRVNTNGTGVEALKTLVGSRRVWVDVDGSDNKLYLTRASKLERRGLSGRSTVTLVSGLQSPGSLVLGGTLPTRSPVVSQPTQPIQTTQPTVVSKYDVNEDGAVNNADTRAVAGAVGQSGDAITNPRTDVDGSGTVDVTDLILVIANLDADVAAPAIDIDVKALDVDFDRVQEQVEVLLASGDRSIAAQRALLYLQHLLASARPDETVLLANYPNPFNPETWIPYHLAESTDVRVNIYDAQGTLVRVLPLGHQTAGYYTSRSRAAYWDGRNALGERVASGIYFYQLQTDAVSPMRKMVILK